MPGTIQVSVLDLTGLPFSPSSSPISIKISIGKTQYQTQDRGDFSFPLLTLRDNLIVVIEDSEGNELSRTGVATMAVVQKEFWDDLFPLEGGGHLRMKLQFILSEEERKRIRNMRESALKKKNKELQSSVRGSETSTAVGGDVASALSLNYEVSDSRDRPLQGKALSNTSEYLQDGSEVTSPVSTPLQTVRIHLTEAKHEDLLEKIEIKSPSADFPVGPISSQETLDHQLGFSESFVDEGDNSVSASLKEDQAHGPEKQSALGKTPSNVRMMISAFETSLSQPDGNKGPASHVNPTETNSQSCKTGTNPLKGPSSYETKTDKSKQMHKILVSGANSLFTGRLWESQHVPTHIRKIGEPVGLDTSEGMQSSYSPGKVELGATQTWDRNSNSSENMMLIGMHKEKDKQVERTSPTRSSMPVRAIASERIPDAKVGTDTPFSLCTNQKDSSGSSDLEECGWETGLNHSQNLNREASLENQKSIFYFECDDYGFEGYGSWMFPGVARPLCITTGGKKVRDILGGCNVYVETHQRRVNLPEAVKEHVILNEINIEVNKDEKTSTNPRKSEVKSLVDVETSIGLIRQAVRVAIMVGFGILVLITRQTETSR